MVLVARRNKIEFLQRLLPELRRVLGNVVITQRGRAAAVILSVQDYEREEHERHLLKLLAREGAIHALGPSAVAA